MSIVSLRDTHADGKIASNPSVRSFLLSLLYLIPLPCGRNRNHFFVVARVALLFCSQGIHEFILFPY